MLAFSGQGAITQVHVDHRKETYAQNSFSKEANKEEDIMSKQTMANLNCNCVYLVLIGRQMSEKIELVHVWSALSLLEQISVSNRQSMGLRLRFRSCYTSIKHRKN